MFLALEHNPVKPRTRTVIGVTGVLLVLAVVAFFFFRHQVRKSFPLTEGMVQVSGLTAPVDVYRDEYGVPLVAAGTEHDLMFAIGYVHAQDRLWQMDLVRHAGEGRLSELFGTETVPFDHLFRVVGLRRTADSICAQLDGPRTGATGLVCRGSQCIHRIQPRPVSGRVRPPRA